MALYLLYRISDKGNVKTKLPHANKYYCLENFIKVFGKENLIVFADNCTTQTIDHIKRLDLQTIEIALGNGPSFIFAADYALKNFAANDSIYFIEDDYLHLPGSKNVLVEGLEIGDYVTLYDSPDKYIDFVNGGDNHYIMAGGEETRVLLTYSSHWKISVSATMTFACSMKTLQEDMKTWRFFMTQDYLAFQRLTGYPLRFKDDIKVLKNKLSGYRLRSISGFKPFLKTIYRYYKNKYSKPKRKLVTSIPGKATHAEIDHLSPLVDWTLI